MKERSQRLKAVKKIIRENRVTSQEELLGILRHHGYRVTQATLSRDLKVLKVAKVSRGSDGYYYALPSEEERKESERNYIYDFVRGYVSIKFSQNIGVIRTLNGHADSVAIALDNLIGDAVLGTIAGDDTVIAVLEQDTQQEEFMRLLREKIPEIEE